MSTARSAAAKSSLKTWCSHDDPSHKLPEPYPNAGLPGEGATRPLLRQCRCLLPQGHPPGPGVPGGAFSRRILLGLGCSNRQRERRQRWLTGATPRWKRTGRREPPGKCAAKVQQLTRSVATPACGLPSCLPNRANHRQTGARGDQRANVAVSAATRIYRKPATRGCPVAARWSRVSATNIRWGAP